VAYNWGEGNLSRLGEFNLQRDLDKLPKETKAYLNQFLSFIEETK